MVGDLFAVGFEQAVIGDLAAGKTRLVDAVVKPVVYLCVQRVDGGGQIGGIEVGLASNQTGKSGVEHAYDISAFIADHRVGFLVPKDRNRCAPRVIFGG